MGNGTKVALVALLIVMVVVVAKFVSTASRDSEAARAEGDPAVEAPPASDGETSPPEASGSESAEPEPGLAGSGSSSSSGDETGEPASEQGPAVAAGLGSRLPRPLPAPSPAPRERTPGRGTAAGSEAGSGASSGGSFVPIQSGRSEPGTSTGSSPRGPLVETRTQDPAASRPPESIEEKKRQIAEEREHYDDVRRERLSGSDSTRDGGASGPGSGTRTFGNPPNRSEASDGTATRSEDTRPRTASFRPGSGAADDEPEPVPSDPGPSGSGQGSHEIREGDSWWAIAKQHYGYGVVWPELKKANPGVSMRPGKELVIPELDPKVIEAAREKARRAARSEVERSSPDGGSSSSSTSTGGYISYKVQRGDTLRGLAKRYLGDPNLYHRIEDANKDVKYTGLIAGTTIRIPKQ